MKTRFSPLLLARYLSGFVDRTECLRRAIFFLGELIDTCVITDNQGDAFRELDIESYATSRQKTRVYISLGKQPHSKSKPICMKRHADVSAVHRLVFHRTERPVYFRHSEKPPSTIVFLIDPPNSMQCEKAFIAPGFRRHLAQSQICREIVESGLTVLQEKPSDSRETQ